MTRSAGIAARRVGKALLVVGFLQWLGTNRMDDLPLLLSLLPSVLIPSGVFIFYRGRQLVARSTEPDLRSPGSRVLYLRSFKDDPSAVRETLLSLFNFPARFPLDGFITEEEQLAEVLRPFGPMIAIGRPGEWLPAPGAGRTYVHDSHWHATVNREMSRACLVVIRLGSSSGLLWEIRRAREVVDPSRLLLFAPSRRRVERALAEVRRLCWMTLPRPTRHGGFYWFSPTWEPRFLPIQTPLMRRGYKRFRADCVFALRPVFEHFRVPWKEPRISILSIPGLIVLFLLAFLTWFVLLLLSV